jgi:cytochrome P450
MQLSELPFLDISSPEFANDRFRVTREAWDQSWIYRSQRGVEILSYEPQWAMLRDRRLNQDQEGMLRDSGVTHPEVVRYPTELMNATTGSTHGKAAIRCCGTLHHGGRREDARTRAEFHRQVMDELDPTGTVDLLEAVCARVPAMTFTYMVHAPLEDEPFVMRISKSIMLIGERKPEYHQEIEGAYLELFEYIEERFSQIEGEEPGDDPLSALVSAIRRGKISRREAMDLAVLILEASTDNTVHQMALAVSVLLEHPQQWAQLQGHPELIAQAVEEAIRVRPRALFNERLAPEDLEWRGLEVPDRTSFLLSTIGANRDPDAYPNPEVFDIHREKPSPNIMFGGGMTHCLGSNIARIEIQEFVSALATRYPKIQPAGPASWRCKRSRRRVACPQCHAGLGAAAAPGAQPVRRCARRLPSRS